LSFALRDYQSVAVEFLVARDRGFVVAPAGAGKTAILAATVARKGWTGARAGILVNPREQVDQVLSAFSRISGPEMQIDVQCAAAMPDFSRCDIVVVDEAHHSPAASWMATIRQSGKILYGVSATPWSEDEERNKVLRELFVDFHSIDRAVLLESGHLAPGKVYLHDLDRPGEFDADIEREAAQEIIRRSRRFPQIPRFEHERRVTWQVTQEYVQRNPARNAAAVALTLAEAQRGESVLMLIHSIEHGQQLQERIPGSELVFSKIGTKKRRERIEAFRSGSLKVLIASSLADEGLDCPRASRLVLVCGGRSAAKLEQRAGRVLRPFEGKQGGVVIDFLDVGARFAHAQANARMRVYSKLGYDPEIVSV